MKRRLFTLLAAVSLLLFVATVVLWVRSYWLQDAATLQRVQSVTVGQMERRNWTIESLNGGVRVEFQRTTGTGFFNWIDTPLEYGTAKPMLSGYPYWIADPPEMRFRGLGFQLIVADWNDLSTNDKKHSVSVVAPWAAITSIAAIMPAVEFGNRYRRCREMRRRNLCAKCGYDLRATPDRCPECGAVPEVKEQSVSA